MAQGWAEVMRASRQSLAPEPEIPEPMEAVVASQELTITKSEQVVEEITQSSGKDLVMSPENWITVAQAIAKPPAYLQRIQEVTTKPLQEKAVTAMEKDFAAFQQSMTALGQ